MEISSEFMPRPSFCDIPSTSKNIDDDIERRHDNNTQGFENLKIGTSFILATWKPHDTHDLIACEIVWEKEAYRLKSTLFRIT